jgi:hypothetical protein
VATACRSHLEREIRTAAKVHLHLDLAEQDLSTYHVGEKLYYVSFMTQCELKFSELRRLKDELGFVTDITIELTRCDGDMMSYTDISEYEIEVTLECNSDLSVV